MGNFVQKLEKNEYNLINEGEMWYIFEGFSLSYFIKTTRFNE